MKKKNNKKNKEKEHTLHWRQFVYERIVAKKIKNLVVIYFACGVYTKSRER